MDPRPDTFPAGSRQITGTLGSIPTEVSRLDFSDKILLTISQHGRLSQWIQVPLTGSSADQVEMALPSAGTSLLPSAHLTPKTLLGGGGQDRETIGQLYAAQVASQISLRAPDDRRILVLGLGVDLAQFQADAKASSRADAQRQTFFDFLELVQRVL
ncbi:proteasome assembly chaperone 3 [Geosmithia morbida]|uniref:Proteasome assembly chaperone 3 n=1 Tax=Geosmithia morbida TaxID=1094350 RepID=A0A9P5CZJ2_9HYPO|nr:proteasome assembly chaperone 3 [Geosmithia morbida]KAF4120557.1 proteasome assembly chaperone 3 [Geosmithia morbida]